MCDIENCIRYSRQDVCVLLGYKNISSGIAMYLVGEKLKWADSVRHLSEIVNTDLRHVFNIQLKKGVGGSWVM